MKKRKLKTVSTLQIRLLLVGLLALLMLVIWFFNSYESEPRQQSDTTTPVIADDIGQIISPMLEDDNFTFVFEDELPNPIRLSNANKHSDKRHQLALIIDDVGYDLHALQRLLALPFTLTVAILPDAPYAKEAAQLAYQHGVKVMLHMPMQTSNPKYQQKMERFYLHQDMDKQAFTRVFEAALAKVPHAEGINNHMGSALTANPKAMRWLMALCKKHHLFFIDSRTSAQSVAVSLAKDAGISWNARDIFLDHSVKAQALQHAWQSTVSCVRKSDHCVVLAHPHQETLNFLEQYATGIHHQSFIPITEVLKQG